MLIPECMGINQPRRGCMSHKLGLSYRKVAISSGEADFSCIFSTPTKTKMEPENTPFGKGETSTNHQFWGSMLFFEGV